MNKKNYYLHDSNIYLPFQLNQQNIICRKIMLLIQLTTFNIPYLKLNAKKIKKIMNTYEHISKLKKRNKKNIYIAYIQYGEV